MAGGRPVEGAVVGDQAADTRDAMRGEKYPHLGEEPQFRDVVGGRRGRGNCPFTITGQS